MKTFADEKEALYRSLSEGRLSPVRGLVHLLDRLDAHAIPVAVATSAPPDNVGHTLSELGLAARLSCIVRSDQVPRGKPFPDGYLRACEFLGSDPARSVAVEDSTNGVRSAFAAGMKVVCVPPGFHPPAEDTLALCAAVLDTLDGLTEELLRSFAS